MLSLVAILCIITIAIAILKRKKGRLSSLKTNVIVAVCASLLFFLFIFESLMALMIWDYDPRCLQILADDSIQVNEQIQQWGELREYRLPLYKWLLYFG